MSAEDIENNEFVEHFKKYGKVDKLTRPMLNELVDSIVIFDNNHVEINFKFRMFFKTQFRCLKHGNSKYLQAQFVPAFYSIDSRGNNILK